MSLRVTIHPWPLYCAGEAVSRRLSHPRGWLRPGPGSVCQSCKDRRAGHTAPLVTTSYLVTTTLYPGAPASPRPVSSVSGTSSHIRHAMDDKEYFRRQDKSFKHYILQSDHNKTYDTLIHVFKTVHFGLISLWTEVNCKVNYFSIQIILSVFISENWIPIKLSWQF